MTENILVTGAQGCIGAWVVKTILDRGDRPLVFDLSTDHRRIADLLEPDQMAQVRFFQGDITDNRTVHRVLEQSEATKVIHLAGLQVPFCKANPISGAMVNVVGTLNVFQAAVKCGVTRVVYASSAAVYGRESGDHPRSEQDPAEASTHYGVFKRANEGNARVFYLDDGLDTVGLRPLTVYGVGRDQGLTSGPTSAMKAAVLGKPFTVGFQGATDYQYVGDTAATFLLCADQAPSGAKIYNLHGDSVEVQEIVDLIQKHLPEGQTADIRISGPELPVPPAMKDDALRGDLGELPRTSLSDGIRVTMARFARLHDEGRLDTRDLPT
ncbi:MAG: NAD-dependent epimerase/dehydratase family protein [Planctomycetota bacterium]|nr:MAG: NAD-dependent epimerase/dehydratase family protein [Planctomycetota bacterium]